MINKVVSYESLAVLLLLEKDFEPTPEVFRCQPKVKLTIPFDEYLNFVEYELGVVDFLATPSKELQALVREYRLGNEDSGKKLFSAFLKDMAFAVCKELYYAESLGKGATSIVHSVHAGTEMSEQDIETYFANVVNQVVPKLVKGLSCKDYAMPNQISAQNAIHFKYAVVMYYLSTAPQFYWSYL